jgi:hypothetical protein
MELQKFASLCLSIGTACFLASCVHRLPPPPPATNFEPGPAPTPLSFAPGAKTKSLELISLNIRMSAGTPIGAVEVGSDCHPIGVATSGASVPLAPNSPWIRIFFTQAKTANYSVLNDPDNPFEDKKNLKPDYQVAGEIIRWKHNVCFPGGIVNYVQAEHWEEQAFDVEWKVYDTARKSIVLTFNTHGYGKDPTPFTGAQVGPAFLQAVESNVRGLLANDELHALVSPKS